MWKTWTLGRILNVDVKIHSTFLLLLGFFALSGLFRGGWLDAALSLALAVIIFTVIVMHEFGHIIAARFYGYQTRDIILSPIGGMARIQGLPEQPKQEMVVAAAGPAVNLVLAGAAAGVMALVPFASMGAGGQFTAALGQWFLGTNLVLLLFNLIPALPMDGGRILRALLARKYGHLRATQKAAKVARWTALAMAVYAVATAHFMLLLVAGFVFMMSWAELLQAHVRQAQSRGQSGFFGGGGRRTVVVDQFGRPVGGSHGHSAGGSSGQSQQGDGWQVTSVRWIDQ